MLNDNKVVASEERTQIVEGLFSNMLEIYKAKNKDYGDSFVKVRNEFPNAILIRLSDKLNRLKSLYEKGEMEVLDESIEDTLIDLGNYAVMEVAEMRYEKKKCEERQLINVE